MKSWTRREFGGLTGAAVLTALRPRRAHSQAKAKVVVIGGGVGGAKSTEGGLEITASFSTVKLGFGL